MSEPAGPPPLTEECLIEAGPGRVLAATLYFPAASAAAKERPAGLIVGHGAGSNRRRHEPFCREACAAGLVVLSFDFRGHGESNGYLDGPAEEDVLSARRFLLADGRVDGRRLGYRGSSMGGLYGLRAAAAEPAGFAALALLCPATDRILLEALGDLRGRGEYRQDALGFRYDAAVLRDHLEAGDVSRDASRVTCPVLLVHARGDQVVPLECSLRLASALRGPTEVIILPSGSHSTAQGSPEMHRRVAGWLADQLRAAPAR